MAEYVTVPEIETMHRRLSLLREYLNLANDSSFYNLLVIVHLVLYDVMHNSITFEQSRVKVVITA